MDTFQGNLISRVCHAPAFRGGPVRCMEIVGAICENGASYDTRDGVGMQYVNLGQAGVKVSRIALGMGLRGIGDAAEAARFVEYAIDRGVNFIDCANRYGLLDNRVDARGTSEQALSRVLKTRRDDVVLTTKVRGPMADGPNDAGTSRYHILREIDRSLARLGTDHVDIYLLHGLDPETPMDETLRALDDIVTQGKARYVGCCNYQAWQVCKSLWGADRLGTDPFVCVQNMYNMLNRSLENEMFPFLRDSGLGLMVYSPLAIGLLSGHYRPGQSPPSGSLWSQFSREDYDRGFPMRAGAVLDVIEEIAADRGVTAAQVALNWVLSHSEVTAAITGSDSVERLDDTLATLDWELDGEERTRLDEVSKAF